MQKKGFTLIEILVVATIIVLLSAIGLVSYSQFSKQARDARRKSDIENIRGSLEIYRSSNNYYPLTLQLLVPSFIKSVPVDPKPGSGYVYSYYPGPSGCNNSTVNCTTYYVNARLETGGFYEANPLGSSSGIGSTSVP